MTNLFLRLNKYPTENLHQIYSSLLQIRWGLTSEDCIVIEDSAAGIEAAISADMRVIGFLGGGHARHDWYQEKIQAYDVPIARNCNELLQVLKNLLSTQVLTVKTSRARESVKQY